MIFYVMDSIILKGVLKNDVVGRERVIWWNMVFIELDCEKDKVRLIV